MHMECRCKKLVDKKQYVIYKKYIQDETFLNSGHFLEANGYGTIFHGLGCLTVAHVYETRSYGQDIAAHDNHGWGLHIH